MASDWHWWIATNGQCGSRCNCFSCVSPGSLWFRETSCDDIKVMFMGGWDHLWFHAEVLPKYASPVRQAPGIAASSGLPPELARLICNYQPKSRIGSDGFLALLNDAMQPENIVKWRLGSWQTPDQCPISDMGRRISEPGIFSRGEVAIAEEVSTITGVSTMIITLTMV